MKNRVLLGVILIGMTATNLLSQPRMACTLTVSDNAGGNQTLKLGIDSKATDGIDAALGEVERPPAPPTGAFDARFIGDDIGISIGQGTLIDFRPGSVLSDLTCIHEIKYQTMTGGTKITLGWNLPKGITLRIQDIITGTLIDVAASGSGDYTISNPGGFNKLKLTATYDASELSRERVTNTLTVNDNAGSNQILTWGLDTAATDGFDAALGEVVRPPVPPTGAFDVRFIGDDIGIPLGEGSLVDYREGNMLTDRTCVHEIKFQAKAGATEITLAWKFILGATLHIQDIITGAIIDVTVSGSGSYTITNPAAISKLKLTVSYKADEMPVELSAFNASGSGNHVTLQWRTATEINNYGFSVERCAGNGLQASASWQTIGFVDGSGTCWTPKEYAFTDRPPLASQKYYYRLKQINRDGSFTYSHAIEASIARPVVFDLKQNFPNPFNPSTTIRYALPIATHVMLKIFDMRGVEVAVLVDRHEDAGYKSVSFDASGLAAGVYFCRLRAGDFHKTQKLLLVR